MELGMSMRYVQIRAKMRAKGAPICADHVFYVLLQLAGKDAGEVAPSAGDDVKNTIAAEIKELKNDLDAAFPGVNSNALLKEIDNSQFENTGASRYDALLQRAATLAPGKTLTPAMMLELVMASPAGAKIAEICKTAGGGNEDMETAINTAKPQVNQVPPPPRQEAVPPPSPPPPPRRPQGGPRVIIEGPNGNLAGHIAGGKFVPEADGGKFPPGPAEAGTSVKGRGGAIAAHILISLLAGLGGSAGIISLTGGSLWPPPVTVNYPLFCWIVFWAAVTGYGIARAIGLKFPAFSCFLRFAIALAGAFVLRRQTIFALHLQRAPWWLDTALFLVYLAAYIYATVSLTGLVKRTDPNASTASAFRKGAVKTTPAIEYFFMLTFSSLLPAIVLYIAACLTTERLPSVWPHITGIYGFLWAYWALKEIFRNHAAARNFSELSMDQQLKYNIFASLNILMTLLLPPFLVLFLHWYFKWFPMMVPVIVALGVYSLLMIFLVVAIHGSKKTSIIVKNIKAGG